MPGRAPRHGGRLRGWKAARCGGSLSLVVLGACPCVLDEALVALLEVCSSFSTAARSRRADRSLSLLETFP